MDYNNFIMRSQELKDFEQEQDSKKKELNTVTISEEKKENE